MRHHERNAALGAAMMALAALGYGTWKVLCWLAPWALCLLGSL